MMINILRWVQRRVDDIARETTRGYPAPHWWPSVVVEIIRNCLEED